MVAKGSLDQAYNQVARIGKYYVYALTAIGLMAGSALVFVGAVGYHGSSSRQVSYASLREVAMGATTIAMVLFNYWLAMRFKVVRAFEGGKLLYSLV